MAGVEEKMFLGKIRAAFALHPLVLNCECIYLVTLAAAPAAAGGDCGNDRGVAHSSTNSRHQNQTSFALQSRLKPSSSPILFHPFSVWLWLLRHLQCWAEATLCSVSLVIVELSSPYHTSQSSKPSLKYKLIQPVFFPDAILILNRALALLLWVGSGGRDERQGNRNAQSEEL